MLFDTEKILTHQNNEKYLIDIVFFNTLINNINYELSYIYYKNINYDEFIRDKFKNMLDIKLRHLLAYDHFEAFNIKQEI